MNLGKIVHSTGVMLTRHPHKLVAIERWPWISQFVIKSGPWNYFMHPFSRA